MTLGDFLNVIGGEYVRISEGSFLHVIYDADKNAIRAYKPELLDREVCDITPFSKTTFEVLIK